MKQVNVRHDNDLLCTDCITLHYCILISAIQLQPLNGKCKLSKMGPVHRMEADEDPYEQVKTFPYISSRLPEVSGSDTNYNITSNCPQGQAVTRSELRVSGAEVTCLLLMLLLFLYACFLFFTSWKKNYRMPEGVFYFEEKPVETTANSELPKEVKIFISLTKTVSADPRLETKISMNFVPWESFDKNTFMDVVENSSSTMMKGSFKIRRAKSDAAYKFRKNRIRLKKSKSFNQRFVAESCNV